MIHTFIPFCPNGGKNLGLAYNLCMDRVGDDDWACFVDHDAMFTTNLWYSQLEGIIEVPGRDIGVLTCVTNRVGNEEQLVFPKDSPEAKNHDVYFHRKVGTDMVYANGYQVREARNPISGVILVTSKRVWKLVGGFKDGFIGVDNDYDMRTRGAGNVTYIADGLYVYHWYRAAPVPGSDCLPCGYVKDTFLPPA